MQITETCPPNQEWIDWAVDRWLSLDPTSPQARTLLEEIFTENARRLLRRKPRRLRSRDVAYRRDIETLRTAIWHRTRKQLRARLRELGKGDLSLRSVPASRQVDLLGNAGVVPTAQTRPQWVCQRCKMDRFEQPCGDPHSGQCPMVGSTSGVPTADPPAPASIGGPHA